MIEKMKKLTIIVPENDTERFIGKLGEAGVLHIKHVSEPESHNTRYYEDRIDKIDRLLKTLSVFASEGEENKDLSCKGGKLMDRAEEIIEKAQDLEELRSRDREITLQLDELKVWQGVTEEDLEVLREKGVHAELARASRKDFAQIAGREDVYRVKEKGGEVLFAVIGPGDPDLAIEHDPVKPPARGAEDLEKEQAQIHARKEKIETTLREEARCIPALEQYRGSLESELEFFRVEAGMKKESRVSYVQGWCPTKRLEVIERLAEKEGAAYLAEDPDNPEEVPTHITNPAWIRIIRPVFDFMNTVPGYTEFDISFFFLVFFSLFFAMLIGDAGYGLFFLGATLWAHRKARTPRKEIFFLMYVLAGATVVWGALTGTWFGSERIAAMPGFKDITVPAIGSFAEGTQDNIIFFCFVIGAVQLTLAHLLKAIRFAPSPKALADIGWCGIIWGMFAAAGTFVLGRAFPASGAWALGVGAVLVLVFQNFSGNILKGALSTLTELPLSIISSFSDVVSYLRLFAVGYATVVLASTFNAMAAEMGSGPALAGFLGGIVLVAGHLLNIALAIMAVVVHGIRLNMLEFSSHLGMQWSGTRYEPFSREKVSHKAQGG